MPRIAAPHRIMNRPREKAIETAIVKAALSIAAGIRPSTHRC